MFADSRSGALHLADWSWRSECYVMGTRKASTTFGSPSTSTWAKVRRPWSNKTRSASVPTRWRTDLRRL